MRFSKYLSECRVFVVAQSECRVFVVAQSCPTLCNPMDCSMPGFPFLHHVTMSNSCTLNQWCHPTISSSIIPFSSCLQSLPASGPFLVSWLFSWGGQSIEASASASVLPMNIHDWSPLGLTGLISLQSKGVSRVFYNTTAQKHRFFSIQPSAFFMVQFSHPYMTSGKIIALTRQTFVSKVMSLLLNLLSRFVIVLFPSSKRLLILWLQSPSVVILEPKKMKSVTVSPSICYEVMRLNVMILVFWILSFKPAFSLSCFTFIKRLFSSSSLSDRWCHLHMWGYWYFSWRSWFYIALMHSFPNLEPVHCFMSGSNCCFLTCIQVSQEAGQVVWYSHL